MNIRSVALAISALLAPSCSGCSAPRGPVEAPARSLPTLHGRAPASPGQDFEPAGTRAPDSPQATGAPAPLTETPPTEPAATQGATPPAQEETGSPWSFGGLWFGDLYHVASHHLEGAEGTTGAVLRRAYLTLDADFHANWFGRARVEINQAGEFDTYTFEVAFKDLYLGWNLGRQRLLVGLSPTPTLDLIEEFWGYRYLVRTPMDLQGVASRDTGVALKGPLNDSGTLGYRVMVGAGTEFGAETGQGPRVMGALEWSPGSWVIDLYADSEKLPGPEDRTTLQAFAGYQTPALRWGVQYSYQDREEDPLLELASAFATGSLGERVALVGRVDRIMEPSPAGNNISYLPFDPSAPATFFIGGIEIRIGEHLRITPNTVYTVYDENSAGVAPRSDLLFRLTLFLDLE